MATSGGEYDNQFPGWAGPERPGIITPWAFAEIMEAAGLIHDRNRINEIRIIARASGPVTIEVTYFADERILGMASIAKHNKEEKDAGE